MPWDQIFIASFIIYTMSASQRNLSWVTRADTFTLERNNLRSRTFKNRREKKKKKRTEGIGRGASRWPSWNETTDSKQNLATEAQKWTAWVCRFIFLFGFLSVVGRLLEISISESFLLCCSFLSFPCQSETCSSPWLWGEQGLLQHKCKEKTKVFAVIVLIPTLGFRESKGKSCRRIFVPHLWAIPPWPLSGGWTSWI